jgi:hypothetical protein
MAQVAGRVCKNSSAGVGEAMDVKDRERSAGGRGAAHCW